MVGSVETASSYELAEATIKQQSDLESDSGKQIPGDLAVLERTSSKFGAFSIIGYHEGNVPLRLCLLPKTVEGYI